MRRKKANEVKIRRYQLHPDEDVRTHWMHVRPSTYFRSMNLIYEQIILTFLAEPGHTFRCDWRPTASWAKDTAKTLASKMTGQRDPQLAVLIYAEHIDRYRDAHFETLDLDEVEEPTPVKAPPLRLVEA